MQDDRPASFDEALSGAEALASVMSDLEARSQRFGSAIGTALKAATLGGQGLETVLRGLGQRLADIALSAGLKPLENLVGNALSGALSGAFSGLSGSVTPFADGGVVRQPSFFPMAAGLGLMGEAGAEAILPLARGPDGALGVAAAGAGSAPQIVFNVEASDAASFARSEAQIAALLARSVARGRRGL